MNLKQAWKSFLHSSNNGLSVDELKHLKWMLKEDTYLPEGVMRTMLENAGYKVIQEELWTKKAL